MEKVIVEWRIWAHYIVAAAGTVGDWQADIANPDCGWHVSFTHN